MAGGQINNDWRRLRQGVRDLTLTERLLSLYNAVQARERREASVGAFKVGEKVVYPAHGVGVIEGVQTKVISGSERKFYMLRIIDSDMTIMIPTENVQSVGLRRIIGKDMVAKVYRILRDKKVEIDQQTWNRRYREYTEKIKTGSVLEIAKVLRDLFVLKGDKELSFGERKMLDTARNLLVKELAIAKSHSEEKIMEELRGIFAN
ncbi:MAG TPA: CarD family transcriptional regulator [Candidatus Nitrosopolaris sp.]|nr:CarD family transcriptional regulator [Candidatus Nitrosopolaris sp.]